MFVCLYVFLYGRKDNNNPDDHLKQQIFETVFLERKII